MTEKDREIGRERERDVDGGGQRETVGERKSQTEKQRHTEKHP